MLTMVILIVLNHEWQTQTTTPSLRLQTQSSYSNSAAAVAISTPQKLNFQNLPNPEEALFNKQKQKTATSSNTLIKVKQVSILGERHSGTTWIYE
jgi:hypothetical protein